MDDFEMGVIAERDRIIEKLTQMISESDDSVEQMIFSWIIAEIKDTDETG